jgi:hypothetical protein
MPLSDIVLQILRVKNGEDLILLKDIAPSTRKERIS